VHKTPGQAAGAVQKRKVRGFGATCATEHLPGARLQLRECNVSVSGRLVFAIAQNRRSSRGAGGPSFPLPGPKPPLPLLGQRGQARDEMRDFADRLQFDGSGPVRPSFIRTFLAGRMQRKREIPQDESAASYV